MSDAAYVDQAANWAKRLTSNEARGPDDMENAWRRLEARYAIPWRVFWALRYRKPRELTVSIYQRLAAAYRAECERQRQRFEHEIEITKAAGASEVLVSAAVAVAGETDDPEMSGNCE